MVLTVAVGGATPASAANYPSKTVKLIVPFAAGGSTDLMARVLIQSLSKRLNGAEIVVENRAGGGGAMAMREVVRAAPDGHTLILASANSAVMTPILSDVGYSDADLAPIAQITDLPTNLFVNADSKAKTFADFMKLAGENPGKTTYSTSGAGSLHHIVAELLQREAKKPGLLTHIPYNSGTESITAVLGKHTDVAFANASYAENYVKQQGAMRVIATSAEGGDVNMPDVPTLKSLGYNVTLTSWFGLIARAGTPAELLDLLNEAVKDTLKDPELVKAFPNLGMTVDYLNRADFTKKYQNQYNQLKGVLKDLFPKK
ncbi:MAG: tripartite tricarboxylate transporter substrate binding protein [Deltaproteobacteria bacterium]|jgi:tripartite-type tricarboxylate transporter receptor subunit TctC|nr:tripartite tricarboxylate transporter substrate binding protein [Deltaproteobacteria bacterium]